MTKLVIKEIEWKKVTDALIKYGWDQETFGRSIEWVSPRKRWKIRWVGESKLSMPTMVLVVNKMREDKKLGRYRLDDDCVAYLDLLKDKYPKLRIRGVGIDLKEIIDVIDEVIKEATRIDKSGFTNINLEGAMIKELLDHDDAARMILREGNPVNDKLPPAVDSILQDIAQMIGGISYNDIMKFSGDKKKLVSLCKKFTGLIEDGADENDPELNELVKEICAVVKGGK